MTKRMLIAILSIFTAMLGFFIAGCEPNNDPGNGAFSIEPSSVTLSATDYTVALEAVGGNEPFSWTNSDNSLGSLSGSGRIVTYSRTDKNGESTVTVQDHRGWVASAAITQVGSLPTNQTQLVIIPSSGIVVDASGGTVTLQAYGGTGSYVWDIKSAGGNSTPSGSLAVTTGSSTEYTSTGSGSDTVTLTSGSAAVYVTIDKK